MSPDQILPPSEDAPIEPTFHMLCHLELTLTSVLPACTRLGALRYAEEIHGRIILNAFDSDVFVSNALIDIYAKHGDARIAIYSLLFVGQSKHLLSVKQNFIS